jgi:alpha-glucosidase
VVACAAAAIAVAPAVAVGSVTAHATATRLPAPRSIVVSGGGGSVSISRNPFRLVVRNRAGRAVLSEVPNTSHSAVPYVSEAPSPLGSTTGQTAPLYAPLAFTIGAATEVAYPGSPWAGNLLVGAVAGVQYSAQRVARVSRVHHGVRLRVTTDDPTGTALAVVVRSVGQHFVVRAALVGGALPKDTHATIGDAFTSSAHEAFHGFGGRHDGIDHHGQSFDTWVEEEDFGAGPASKAAGGLPGSGGQSYLFPNGPAAAYYVQPQFISSHGYGFWLHQYQLARWRMDSDTAKAWTVQAASSHLRYVVAPGGASHAIAQLTRMTGRQRVPPRWALGPQLDRLIGITDNAAGYYAKVEADIKAIRRTRLPLTGYRIEGWAILKRAQLRHVIQQLRAMRIHPLIYFRAYTSADPGHTEQPSVFQTALRHGYLATTAAGAPYLEGSPFVAGVAGVIDFTKPAAARWFRRRIQAGLRLGADGFMADFGEQVQPDMHFFNGETGAVMHNRYPVIYQRVVRQAVTGFEKRHPRRHIFFYSRAGYSGSARYESATFAGDETTDWSIASGLASQAPDMLNRAIGGDYGFTTDIGGYEDIISGATDKELFLRWAEWAALSPLFRDHGSADAGTHTPYSYDNQTLRTYIALSNLHSAAAPLIHRLWRRADRTGRPVTRPLWLEYPHDRVAARQEQEWLLGRDVLVAPVVRQGARARRVYLPAGCWRRPTTGRRYRGRRHVTVRAPLTVLTYFFRCGTHPFLPPVTS